MSDDRVRAALRAGAADAPHASDLWSRTQRKACWRRRRRWASQTAAALMVLGSVAVTVAVVSGEPRGQVTLGGPEAGTSDEEDGAPSGWSEVEVGAARISVPDGWEVVHVDDHLEDAAGIDERVDPEGYCPLPDDRLVLFVGQRSPAPCHDDATPPGPAAMPPGVTIIADATILKSRLQQLLSDGVDPRAAPSDDVEQQSTQPSWDDHERLEFHGVPAVVFETYVDSDLGQEHLSEQTVFAPALGLVAETRQTRPHDHAAEIGVVLETLRPADEPLDDVVVIGHRWPDGKPEAGESKPIELRAIDAHARLHRWYETSASDYSREQTMTRWPGATSQRFAAVLRIDGEARVVAGRPGEDGHEVFTFPDDDMVPKPDAWSPSGDAVVWIDRNALTAGLAAWQHPDDLVDGQTPTTEQHVAVDGAEHPDHGEGVGSLYWDGDADVLRDRNWDQIAPIERDATGTPRLPDPLRFEASP